MRAGFYYDLKLTLEEQARMIIQPMKTIHTPVSIQSMVHVANANVKRTLLHVPSVHPGSVALPWEQGTYVSDFTVDHVP